jgi:WXG100 family type VII secretion target
MADIEVNYDELTNIQKLFNNESQGISQLYQETKSKVDALAGQGQSAGWIGRGSEAFSGEMYGVVLPSMQRLTQALIEASSATTRISQTFRSAEEEAKSLFTGENNPSPISISPQSGVNPPVMRSEKDFTSKANINVMRDEPDYSPLTSTQDFTSTQENHGLYQDFANGDDKESPRS